jgi:formylglycine-generating enzyme required for sulfatase activity
MHPVENVLWSDAVEFCKRLSELPEEKKAGRVYRLPSEAEWEYSCRAGSKTTFSFGESSESLGDYAWYKKNSKSETHPVGEKNPNAWGLYDMHGNVWEWCSDWYASYYTKDAVTDPVGPGESLGHVIRGGCWINKPEHCRSAVRLPVVPSYSSGSYGFRVALSPSGIPN